MPNLRISYPDPHQYEPGEPMNFPKFGQRKPRQRHCGLRWASLLTYRFLGCSFCPHALSLLLSAQWFAGKRGATQVWRIP